MHMMRMRLQAMYSPVVYTCVNEHDIPMIAFFTVENGHNYTGLN